MVNITDNETPSTHLSKEGDGNKFGIPFLSKADAADYISRNPKEFTAKERQQIKSDQSRITATGVVHSRELLKGSKRRNIVVRWYI